MLFGHGDNGYTFGKKIVADFSTNVFYKGPSKKLLTFLKKELKNIGKYPEVAAESLTTNIAKKYQLYANNILITNGATEAFYLLAQLFKQQSSEIFIPSFAEYEDACSVHNHTITFTNNTLLNNTYKTTSSLIWICNPNNPDGNIMHRKDLCFLIKNNPKSMFIVDEAYTDFTVHEISLIQELKNLPNLILVHSLTKKHAIPGLRLGYIATNSSIIEKLLAIKQPWSVNNIAIAAGNFLLEENKVFHTQKLINLSSQLQEELSKIKSVKVIKSETTYFLIQTTKPATETQFYLVNHHGILVRNASNFKSLDDSYIRVSTRSKKENKKLIKALTTWMEV